MNKEETKLPFFPIAIEVEEGKTYYWCGCGKTQTEPFCDHSDCKKAFSFQARLTETLYFCGCKQTKDPPLCDGSHAKLLHEYLQKKENN